MIVRMRREHELYKECVTHHFPPIVGRWQYIYSSKKGKISLIKLIGVGSERWEIYSLEGDLFEDTERFKSKKEAEQKILKLLT